MSLIDGSYEYYHYLHDGIDDNVNVLQAASNQSEFYIVTQVFLQMHMIISSAVWKFPSPALTMHGSLEHWIHPFFSISLDA